MCSAWGHSHQTDRKDCHVPAWGRHICTQLTSWTFSQVVSIPAPWIVDHAALSPYHFIGLLQSAVISPYTHWCNKMIYGTDPQIFDNLKHVLSASILQNRN